MKIVCNKEAHATIIIPEKATKRERFAAQELQRYIFKISNVKIPVAVDTGSKKGNLILIGGPERNRITAACVTEEAFTGLVPGPDGFLIKTYGDLLVLAGSSNHPNEMERGTVYAVYEFLERYLGCSFVAYGKPGAESGEYIPEAENIVTGDITYIKARADLPYRTAIVQFCGTPQKQPNADANHSLAVSCIDWMAKNRLNRILLMMKAYETIKGNGVLEELEKRGISVTAGHHDSGTFFLPPLGNHCFPEKVYETHPEYYKLQPDGSRYFAGTKWEGQLVFDMRNRDCIRQVADNIKAWLKDNPLVDIITLWPNDGNGLQCVCEKCAAHTKTTNYAWFVNEVASLVCGEYPQVKLDMIVYQGLWEPPSGVALGPGVLVEESTWGPGPSLRFFGKKDGSGLIGTYIEKNAMTWSGMAGGMVYYDYYMTSFGGVQVYCPMADEIIKITERFTEKGYCQGTGTQLEAYNIWNYLFNFYTHGRKSYDITLTMEDLLERFVKIFGKGSEHIREYIKYVEDFYEGQTEEGEDGCYCATWFAKNVDKEKVYTLFEKAYQAEPEERIRKNIRLLRMVFRYSDLMINHLGCDELAYMSRKFGSYWQLEGQTGYGIAVFEKPRETSFVPDKWYE